MASFLLTPAVDYWAYSSLSGGDCRIIIYMTSLHPRITIESDKRGGKPCIRGMRITVNDVLGWLANGMTEAEILDEHPDLEKEDFAAFYSFASEVTDRAYDGASQAALKDHSAVPFTS